MYIYIYIYQYLSPIHIYERMTRREILKPKDIRGRSFDVLLFPNTDLNKSAADFFIMPFKRQKHRNQDSA